MMHVSMDTLVNLAKARGFVFPGSEIYGGMANSWDYGPLGVELKNNIKQLWWKKFVTSRLDMVGIDAALVMNPKVWEASGHLSNFSDPLVECKQCHERYRADQINLEAACQKCGTKGSFTTPASFNLMMRTYIGSVDPVKDVQEMYSKFVSPEGVSKFKTKDDLVSAFAGAEELAKALDKSLAYFRPETAQAMFVDFPQVLQSSRKRVPFGIAQIGKAFRNEITPGNFIFRTREFEQMEIEYFVHPSDAERQFEHWLGQQKEWLEEIGVDKDRLHFVEISEADRAFYSKRSVDTEFDYPFGQKELYGIAYRTDYDLSQHEKHSGANLKYTDPMTGEKYTPHVIEPSFGVDRTLLAVLLSAYDEEEAPTSEEGESATRVVLRFRPALAPIKVAILPLSKKEELSSVARPLAERLAKRWRVDYDETQSIGKRYRRQDEIGTPFCVTVDFDSLNDNAVTVRDRDTMQQERVAIADLENHLAQKLAL